MLNVHSGGTMAAQAPIKLRREIEFSTGGVMGEDF